MSEAPFASRSCRVEVAPDVFRWLTPAHEPDIAWSDEAGGYTCACTCGWVAKTILIRGSEAGLRQHFQEVGRV